MEALLNNPTQLDAYSADAMETYSQSLSDEPERESMIEWLGGYARRHRRTGQKPPPFPTEFVELLQLSEMLCTGGTAVRSPREDGTASLELRPSHDSSQADVDEHALANSPASQRANENPLAETLFEQLRDAKFPTAQELLKERPELINAADG